jgi:hypothetical protein
MNSNFTLYMLCSWSRFRCRLHWVAVNYHPRNFKRKSWWNYYVPVTQKLSRETWIACCAWLGLLGHTHKWKLGYVWTADHSDYVCELCAAEKTDTTPAHEARRCESMARLKRKASQTAPRDVL